MRAVADETRVTRTETPSNAGWATEDRSALRSSLELAIRVSGLLGTGSHGSYGLRVARSLVASLIDQLRKLERSDEHVAERPHASGDEDSRA
jgi:hypothetical protein